MDILSVIREAERYLKLNNFNAQKVLIFKNIVVLYSQGSKAQGKISVMNNHGDLVSERW